MGRGCVWKKCLAVEDKELVHSVGQNLALHFSLDACASHYGM